MSFRVSLERPHSTSSSVGRSQKLYHPTPWPHPPCVPLFGGVFSHSACLQHRKVPQTPPSSSCSHKIRQRHHHREDTAVFCQILPLLGAAAEQVGHVSRFGAPRAEPQPQLSCSTGFEQGQIQHSQLPLGKATQPDCSAGTDPRARPCPQARGKEREFAPRSLTGSSGGNRPTASRDWQERRVRNARSTTRLATIPIGRPLTDSSQGQENQAHCTDTEEMAPSPKKITP